MRITKQAAADKDGSVGLTRRGLLGGFASTAGLMALPGQAIGRVLAPSDRVNIAVIGAGGMGASNMEKLTSQNIGKRFATASRFNTLYCARSNEIVIRGLLVAIRPPVCTVMHYTTE